MDNTGYLIVLVLIAVFVFFWLNGSTCMSLPRITEGMAPLNHGSFETNLNNGHCNVDLSAPSECSVGNCPLGTTVSDERYCAIQCAQEVNADDRQKCQAQCMEMMKGCGSGY
jgi:hypothetical protein